MPNLFGASFMYDLKLSDEKFVKFLTQYFKRTTDIFYYDIFQDPNQVKRLGALQIELNALNINFEFSLVNGPKDVDLLIVSELGDILSDRVKPKKIILGSGDKDFARILSTAKRHKVEIIVMAGKDSCARILMSMADKIELINKNFIEENKLARS